MSGITIVSSHSNLESTLIRYYGRTMPVRRVWSDQWHHPGEVAVDAGAADPELIVLGSDIGPDGLKMIVPEIDQRFPTTTVVCLIIERDPMLAMEILRLGARDVLLDGGTPEELQAEIDPVVQVAQARYRRAAEGEAETRRRVIAVVSPKGGSGKTTLSTNLAVGLANRMPKQVVLIDLDVQFGDCAPALGLDPQYSLVDAVLAATHERTALKVFPATHHSGLAVLPPPDDLVAAEELESDQLKRTLSAFAEEFPMVVVDTASGIDSDTLAAMELATDLVLITTTDVPAIRAIRRQLDALDKIGYVSQRRTFVLNRANARVGLSVDEIEAVVGLPATFQIPSTRLIPIATNEGVAVIERDRGGNLARRFEEIVDHFAPPAETRGRGLFRRRERG